MRLSVDPWDPSYGTSVDDAAAESDAAVDVEVERAGADWAPVGAPAGLEVPGRVLFVDGVRRVDARLWIAGDEPGPPAAGGGAAPAGGPGVTGEPTADPAAPEAGLAASWAAGVVVCDGQARVGAVEVGRGLFSASAAAVDLVSRHGTYRRHPAHSGAPEQLSLALQQAMTASEVAVAHQARPPGDPSLLVVDGPLRGRQSLTDALGLIKTHHTHYLPGAKRGVLGALGAGQRTPVFRIASAWIRHSWYLRLPGGGSGPMAGIVRCECSAELSTEAAVRLAGWSAAVLPRFASEPHKDARAPQNLYPIGGLERELRRRLGDARLLYRSLLEAAAA